MPALARTGDETRPRARGPRSKCSAPEGRLPLGPRAEAQVFGIGREALGQRRQARGGEHGLDQRRGAAGARDRRDPRRRPRLRAGRRAIPVTSASSRCAAAPPRSAAQLSITSGPGQGTVVRVEAPAEGNGRSDGAEPGDPIKVLVVDDHAVVRRGLRAFFESEPDLEVVGAADGGTQALDLLEGLEAAGPAARRGRHGPADAAADGIESTRLIRARYDDVEVVVLTSYADDELVRGALRGRSVGVPPQGRRRRRGRGGHARRGSRRAAARPRGRPATALVAGRGFARRGHGGSHRARARGPAAAWGRAAANKEIAGRARASASGRPARTCRTSWASWASHRARKPPCGRCARAWWTWTPADAARGFHPVRAMLRARAVPTIERHSRMSARKGQ